MPMRTPISETHLRAYPAGCRRRLPNTGPRCAFNPIPRARISPWQTRYPPLPADSRRRSPNTRRRCGFGPIRGSPLRLGNRAGTRPGRLPEAIAEFESALRSEPDFPEAHVNLGNALAQTPGRLTDAIAEYEAALRIRPDPVVRQMVDRLRAQRQAITPRKSP